jgi:hypothetical protein
MGGPPRLPRFAFDDLSGMECVLPGNFQDWQVREEADGFRVTYTQLDGNDNPKPLRAYRYFVTRDAKVSLMAQRKGKTFSEALEGSR